MDMASQDDIGMVWYGLQNIYPTDPSDVLMNNGGAAPMLSDTPRALITHDQHLVQNVNQSSTSFPYGDPNIIGTQPNQMYYDPNATDCLGQNDNIYESYESYEDDTCVNNEVTNSMLLAMDTQLSAQSAEDDVNMQPKVNKKPKVHQNPALKLKTPIAYQRDTDPNAIPIMKEGMAVCERCGAIGVKHAFYGKERKYCSLGCARLPNMTMIKRPPDESDDDNQELAESESYELPVTNHHQLLQRVEEMEMAALSYPCEKMLSTGEEEINSFKWENSFLRSENIYAAPVRAFYHAPMNEYWQVFERGIKIEIPCMENCLIKEIKEAYWIANVIKVQGYKANVRYEGVGDDYSKDFWMEICSNNVHPVGWCATQGHALIPPKSIHEKRSDWKEFLLKRLTGARTLPTNFQLKVNDSKKSGFRTGLNLEVVDKNRIAQMRVANVVDVIGKRLHLRYHGASPEDDGFWCHENSPLIHPVGWSRDVGHEIIATHEYHEKCLNRTLDADDATADMFFSNKINLRCFSDFREGMKLEALDPLNLCNISVATIMKVLKDNYLMIKIDVSGGDDSCSDWFCYHASSAYIFPIGFCESQDIPLTTPKAFGNFNWPQYLIATRSKAAPTNAFYREEIDHEFEIGMYLEAVDLIDPKLVCVARIKEVKDRLLKIHFDGWDDEFDQWVDVESPDIFPVGWCDVVQYKLEGPREEMETYPAIPKRKIGRSGKSHIGIENSYPIVDNSIKNGKKFKRKTSEAKLNGENIIMNHKKRGRPRKIPLQNINPMKSEVPNTIKPLRRNYPSFDDGDASDGTSSGVASLAESEVSTDFWDDEGIFNSGHDSGLSSVAAFHAENMNTNLNNGDFTYSNTSLGPILLEGDECKLPQENVDPNPEVQNTYNPFDNLITDTDLALSNEPASVETTGPHLPRIIETTIVPKERLEPSTWTCEHVAVFLSNNDCGAYRQNFITNNVDGNKLLNLTHNDLMSLTKMKVGPSLKIQALIQQLNAIVNPAQARYKATLMKKRNFS